VFSLTSGKRGSNQGRGASSQRFDRHPAKKRMTNIVETKYEIMPTDGVAIPRMKHGILIPALHDSFYPWDCHAIRGHHPFFSQD
jgi:hypothetical protein